MDFCLNSLIEFDKIIDLILKIYSDDLVVEKMYFNLYLKGYSSKNFICIKIKLIWVFFFINKLKLRNYFLVNKIVL